MHCLFCGKEIGALRLLRDSEFCSVSHRKSYKDRLGKVLSRIAVESQSPPPPPAGFRIRFSPFTGNSGYVMDLWQPGTRYPVHGVIHWPVGIPALAHQQTRTLSALEAAIADAGPATALEWVGETVYPELTLDRAGDEAAAGPRPAEAPPLCGPMPAAGAEVHVRATGRVFAEPSLADPAIGTASAQAGWPAATLNHILALAGMQSVPAAEPAAAFVAVAAAHEPVAMASRGLRLPAVPEIAIEQAAAETPGLAGFAAAAAAEPAAAFVAWAAALAPMAMAPVSLRLPGVPEIEREQGAATEDVPGLHGFVAVPAAEAAAAFLAWTAALDPMATVPAALRLPGAAIGLQAGRTPQRSGFAPVPAAEPAALFVASAAALEPVQFAAASPLLPAHPIAAELEPLPVPDEPLVIPAACESLMPPPQAEPVWNFVSAVAAGALAANPPMTRPVLAAGPVRTHVPMATAPRRGPQAEPVMAGVWPRMAEVRVERIEAELAFRLPEITSVPARVQAPAATAAEIPAAEPAASWIAASAALEPAAAAVETRLPRIAALGALPAAGSAAGPLTAPTAEPVEDRAMAASAGPASAALAVSLRPMDLRAETPAGVKFGQVPAVAASAAAPRSSSANVAALKPIAAIQLALPGQETRDAARTAVPRPGLFSIEYHMQRTRSAAYALPEWKCANYQPQPPQFTLRAALDNLEELVRPKQFAGVFPINSPSQGRVRSVVMEHILRVAAAVMIVTSIWFGAAALKNARRVNLRQDEAFATPNRVLTPEVQAAREQAAKAKGPLNWAREAVASRASVQVADDFQHGLNRWGGAGNAAPANWRRTVDGYMQTGELAFFRPTQQYVDYRLEFFGQIEQKSLGWVVRARDDRNYHAMKFTVIERGLRPVIAMVHYDVVDGAQGRRVQIPLNVMVHNNQPIQVAVAVRGKHFVTTVDGEQVDDYREDAMPTGGVGFFSDAGEQARLYWARVTKNDDWLGHVCAFLSGGDTRQTADLWPGSIPGGVPNPWSPSGDPNLLAAAWIGLPSIRRIPSSRRLKRCNR